MRDSAVPWSLSIFLCTHLNSVFLPCKMGWSLQGSWLLSRCQDHVSSALVCSNQTAARFTLLLPTHCSLPSDGIPAHDFTPFTLLRSSHSLCVICSPLTSRSFSNSRQQVLLPHSHSLCLGLKSQTSASTRHRLVLVEIQWRPGSSPSAWLWALPSVILSLIYSLSPYNFSAHSLIWFHIWHRIKCFGTVRAAG